MRRGLVAGNWKMNATQASVQELLSALRSGLSGQTNVDIAVFPPYPYLFQAAELLKDSSIAWGAQNVNKNDDGAFTGEVSAAMLNDFACEYVIVGHSERRTLYAETDAVVADKFAKALQANLKPIVCVGETLDERKAKKTLQIVQKQLEAVLRLHDNLPNFDQAVIAYEPLWAIGTGQTATSDQAQEVHAAIRAQLASVDANLANSMRILYGGSVKPANAAELFAMPDIDGGLVGGASLKADQFIEIVKQCNH